MEKNVKIAKRPDGVYDVYVNNTWELTRGALENVIAWLAEYTALNGPVTILWEE